MAKRKPAVRALPRAESISDFRAGIDRMVRHGARCFLVSRAGDYAPVEVASDVLTPECQRNLETLAPRHLGLALRTIQETPFLSSEGRAERLAILYRRPDVRFTLTVEDAIPKGGHGEGAGRGEHPGSTGGAGSNPGGGEGQGERAGKGARVPAFAGV